MKRILVVDDDKTNLITAKNALSDLYKIIAVPNGAQALFFLENNTCDLILLDINMPEMDGFETLKKIREREALKKIPVIFLTANQDKGSVMEGIRLGVDDYITKPFIYNELRKRVERAFLRKSVPSTKGELAEYLSELLTDMREGATDQAISKIEAMLQLIEQQ